VRGQPVQVAAGQVAVGSAVHTAAGAAAVVRANWCEVSGLTGRPAAFGLGVSCSQASIRLLSLVDSVAR
jgi:hypothetical protein